MFIIYVGALAFGALLLVFALPLAVLLILAMPKAALLAMRGTLTTGEVVRVEKQLPGRAPRVRVAYGTPNGKFETFAAATSQQPQPGQQVPVRYDPAKPSRAAGVTQSGWAAVISVPALLAMSAASAGMITAAVWYFTGTHTRLQVSLAAGSFGLALTLIAGWYTWTRYTKLFRSRRTARVESKTSRHDDLAPSGRTGDVRASAIASTIITLGLAALTVLSITHV